MIVLNIILLGALTYAVYSFFQNTGTAFKIQKAPVDILKERYARGEISLEEYRNMTRDI